MKHTAYKIQLPAGPMVNRRISYDTPRPIQCPRFDTSAEKKDDNPAFTLVNTNTRQPQIGYSPAGINPQKPAPEKLGTEAQHFASVCAFCFFFFTTHFGPIGQWDLIAGWSAPEYYGMYSLGFEWLDKHLRLQRAPGVRCPSLGAGLQTRQRK